LSAQVEEKRTDMDIDIAGAAELKARPSPTNTQVVGLLKKILAQGEK
jgi:hypothetical protein